MNDLDLDKPLPSVIFVFIIELLQKTFNSSIIEYSFHKYESEMFMTSKANINFYLI
jgi:hypothetical protein